MNVQTGDRSTLEPTPPSNKRILPPEGAPETKGANVLIFSSHPSLSQVQADDSIRINQNMVFKKRKKSSALHVNR